MGHNYIRACDFATRKSPGRADSKCDSGVVFASVLLYGILLITERLVKGRRDKNDAKGRMMKKVTVVGAGNVGATVAQRLAEKELCDVVLIDILEGIPQGKALDLAEAAPIEKHDARLTGSNDYQDTADSDIVVITAGIPRKPGMSRDDLLATNKKIVSTVTKHAIQHSPRAILIVISNPLDAMCHVAYEASGFPKERVVGMAGMLDVRVRAFFLLGLNVSGGNTHGFVLGGHGGTTAPLPRSSTGAGRPVPEPLAAIRP